MSTQSIDSKNETVRLLTEIAQGISSLRDEIRYLTSIMEPSAADNARLVEALDHITQAFGGAPAAFASPAGPLISGPYRDFLADTIVLGYDDKGAPTYKMKGHPYSKFGVRVWPEVLPILGIDADSLRPGPNQIAMYVRALLTEDEPAHPRKVIGLASGGAAPAQTSSTLRPAPIRQTAPMPMEEEIPF